MTSFARALAVSFACSLSIGITFANEADPPFTRMPSFLAAHPDLYWREQGVADYERGRYGEAMTAFRRAARHADKTSQAMIAQMLWNGDGEPANRALAYVWADLAAERGYPQFIATRERFWNELSADERRAALAAGPAVFDEYADDVAKRRQERALIVAKRKVTGSRLGHVGTLEVQERLQPWLAYKTDGAIYYADRYWKPEQYWRWQDRTWTQPPEGKVEVGPIQTPPRR